MKLCLHFLFALSVTPFIFGDQSSNDGDATHSKTWSTSCNCGWVNKGRIVGGRETRKNEFPMMVSIQHSWFEAHGCGGTVITPWHVLTAAHCFRDLTEDLIDVVFGVHNLTDSDHQQRISVERIIKHEEYNDDLMINDIALLVTKEKIKFSQNVGPACLPTRRMDIAGQQVKALGWGMTVYKGNAATVLQEVDLSVISDADCVSMWRSSRGRRRPIEDTNVCTFEKRKDTCKGDSGGPLLWFDPEIRRYTITAVVSFGGICGAGRPAVNTDVSSYIDWINQNVQASNPEARVCTKV